MSVSNQEEIFWVVLSITAARKITKEELDSSSPGDLESLLKAIGQSKQRHQISTIIKTKSSKTLISSIKAYLTESGGALPFKFTRLLSTVGPKLGVTKLKAGTLEHQQILIFLTQLSYQQATLLWSVLSFLHGVAENSAGAISCYDVARSFVDCMLSEKLPTPEALDWAYIVVRYLIDNVDALMEQSEGKNNCLIAPETKPQNKAGPRVPAVESASSAITPAEIAQCKLKQQQMATARKFLEAQRLKDLVGLLQQPVDATVPQLHQQLQSLEALKQVLCQNSMSWLQELVLVTKRRDILKERINALTQSTASYPAGGKPADNLAGAAVYPPNTVATHPTAPHIAFGSVAVPTPATPGPFVQPNPAPHIPDVKKLQYSIAANPSAPSAPRPMQYPIAANPSAPSAPRPMQYPIAANPSAASAPRPIAARPIAPRPVTTAPPHKGPTQTKLPPTNPPPNTPVYPSGAPAASTTYPAQTPVKIPDSSANTWKCKMCNTSNTGNMCTGCCMPRPATESKAPIHAVQTGSVRKVWMFAAAGASIFCPYAANLQALLEQQYWKTKALASVTLHTLQLGPDSVYDIKRQQNSLFQVNKKYGTRRNIFRVAGVQQSVGHVLLPDNQQLAVVCGFTLQKNAADATAAVVSLLCVRSLSPPFSKYTMPPSPYIAKPSPVQMSVGATVVRGPDWPPSCNVDGGGRGRVTSFQADGMVVVQWAKAPTPYKHRWGAHSCFDLSLVFAAAGTPAYPGQPFRPPFRPGAPPRPRPPFSAAYPRPSFNAPFNPRAPPRPHPAYPRPGPRAYPNPPQLPGVVPKSLYRCVGGHNLQAFVPRVSSYFCNVCLKPLPLGVVAFGCRLCNFDVCKACDEKPLPTASWGFIEGSNFIPYQIDQSLMVEAGYARFYSSGENPSCNSATIVGGGKRYKICFQPDPRTAPPGAKFEQINESSGYKRPVERREVLWGFIENNAFKAYPPDSACFVETAYQRFKHRGAINSAQINSGGRQYLLTFDETNGHKQTNSNTGTSRALKRQLKAPIPVPVAQPPPPSPAPTPASAPYPTPTAYSPQPTSLYGAIQASHQAAQWGFYGDSGKFVPFQPAQSKAVETAFSANRHYYDITAGSNTYRVHFAKNAKGNFWQENLSSHFKRDVARISGGLSSYKAAYGYNSGHASKSPAPAPAPAPPPSVSATSSSAGIKLDRFRKTWESSGLDSKKTKTVSKGSGEWNKVRSVFRKTLNKSISRIERIENKLQWDGFCMEKAKIQADCESDWSETKMLHELFHGTDVDALSSIVGGLDGFLPLLAGTKVGAIYGNGTYFARDSKYSDDYAARLGNGSRQMLLCFVVVGKRHVGKAGDKMYPLLPKSKVKRYHSLCNKTSGTSIFVVQKGSQAYPAYLITYK